MEATFWCWRYEMDDPELARDAIHDYYEGRVPSGVRILEVLPTGNVREEWEPGFVPSPIFEMQVRWSVLEVVR